MVSAFPRLTINLDEVDGKPAALDLAYTARGVFHLTVVDSVLDRIGDGEDDDHEDGDGDELADAAGEQKRDGGSGAGSGGASSSSSSSGASAAAAGESKQRALPGRGSGKFARIRALLAANRSSLRGVTLLCFSAATLPPALLAEIARCRQLQTLSFSSAPSADLILHQSAMLQKPSFVLNTFRLPEAARRAEVGLLLRPANEWSGLLTIAKPSHLCVLFQLSAAVAAITTACPDLQRLVWPQNIFGDKDLASILSSGSLHVLSESS